MNCSHCGKPVSEGHNYCSWSCQVAQAKEGGGKVITPNNLPIGCIKADGTMLEHEHGDHPDYKFPVTAKYVGPPPPPLEERDPNTCYEERLEMHALLYTDGCIALTMYECCYAMWSLKEGFVMSGFLWGKKEWQFTPEALAKVRALCIR